MMPEARLPAMPMAARCARRIEPKRCRATAAAASAPITAVGWKPALWIACGATRLQPAHDLDADRDAPADVAGRRGRASSAKREHRRHDHRAGMDRPALEGVVEILAMRGGAVDERGIVAVEPPRMADGRRTAARLPRSASAAVT